MNEINKDLVKLSVVEYKGLLIRDDYSKKFRKIEFNWVQRLMNEMSKRWVFIRRYFFFDYWIINNGGKNFVKLSLVESTIACEWDEYLALFSMRLLNYKWWEKIL